MPEIELQHQASLSHPLAHIEGEEGQSFLTQQLRHGDIYVNPSIFDTFASNEERSAWIESYTQLEPEYNENDKQGWTYIADYSMHPDTPYLPADAPTNFFIYAKIDHENKLRFGIFSTHPEKKSTKTSIALARIKDNKTTQLIHGDQRPALRIASKEEAEAKLLKNGKLIRSALPKFVGVLMDMGKARIRLSVSETQIEMTEEGKILSTEHLSGGTFYSTKNYYGHIWSYWANIIDNTLYFVGIPICNSNEQGSIVYTKSGSRTRKDGSSSTNYSTLREKVKLPPTSDDFKSSFSVNGLIRSDTYSAPTHPIYAAVQEAFELKEGQFSTQHLRMENWLQSRLDTETPTTWLTHPLAKISDKKAQQLTHGDISSNLTLLGYEGGVFYDSNTSSFIIAESSEAIYSRIEDAEGQESNAILASSHSGHSGFIPARTAYTIDGKTYYNAQCFYASQQGINYALKTIGGNRPFGVYSNSIRSEDIISLSYHFTETSIVEESTGGGGGGGGGGTTGGDGDGGSNWDEPEEGSLGDVYDYELSSFGDDYPLILTEIPNLISVESYIEANQPSTKEEVQELAQSVSYNLKLNEGSRYLKTPHFRYSIQVQGEGQDGAFMATQGGEELGMRTIAIGGISFSGTGKIREATFSFTTIHGGGDAPFKTATETIYYNSQKQNWRLTGSTSWTAADRVSPPAAVKYLRITSLRTSRVKTPKNWYSLSWTEQWETTDTVNGQTQTTTHTKSFERVFATSSARSSYLENLRADMAANNRTFASGPSGETVESKSYVLVHEKLISAEISAMMDTMLWNENLTVSQSGQLSITSTAGSFTATTINTSITKTLP